MNTYVRRYFYERLKDMWCSNHVQQLNQRCYQDIASRGWVFTEDELTVTREINRELIQQLGRLPSVDERRQLTEILVGDRMNHRDLSSINHRCS
jgi:hypothetical protein